ncbi:MAG: hypothetical protein ACJAS4_002167 [Bacteriovoracaceae bacterium]|jgi:hypothetical protein
MNNLYCINNSCILTTFFTLAVERDFPSLCDKTESILVFSTHLIGSKTRVYIQPEIKRENDIDFD